MASGRPRAVSNYFLGGPKASKSAPRGIQERPIRPWKPSSGLSSLFKSSKRPPRRLQETSRAHLAAMLVPCWSNFATHSKRCCHHVGHVSSLNAPSPRALHPRSQAMFVGVPWPRALTPTPQARQNARERSAAHLWWCWACKILAALRLRPELAQMSQDRARTFRRAFRPVPS